MPVGQSDNGLSSLDVATDATTTDREEFHGSTCTDMLASRRFGYVLYSTLALLHTLGLYPLLHRYLAAKGPPQANVTQVYQSEGDTHWNIAVSNMIYLWKVVCTGCVMLLSLSFGFFQIGGVNESVYARTGALSMFICAGIGLITGIWYISLEAYFRAKRLGDAWLEASQSLDHRSSVDFWMCLSLPFSLLAWSIIFCAVTFLFTIFIDPSQISNSNPTYTNLKRILNITFLSVLTIGQITQVYRSIKYVIRG